VKFKKNSTTLALKNVLNADQIEFSRIHSIESKKVWRDLKKLSNSKPMSQSSKQTQNNETHDSSSQVQEYDELNDENFFIDGFILHMFEKEKPNVYKEVSVVFKHPHKDTCKEWIKIIREKIPSNFLVLYR
jgi:hypothetical protein